MFLHLALIIKHRRKVMDNMISDRLKEIFPYIAPNCHIALMEWNHGIDHIHVLYKAHPNTEHSKFTNACKSAGSRIIKKENESIRKKLWKEYFWSRSFCLLTAGGASIEAIERCIENQGGK
jgi:putative transposase